MLHKVMLGAAALLAAVCVQAQKPVVAAVTDIEDDPANGLEMCRSLFNEYYLSELTTHAKVNMLDTASIQKNIAKLQFQRGVSLSEKQIQNLCRELKIDAVCLVKMVRNPKHAIEITVSMVSKTGKPIGSVSATMEGIGDTDAVSSKLAVESAKILRRLNGINEGIIPLETHPTEKLPSTVTEI